MAKWLVCATRDASEDAAAIVEAEDRDAAEVEFGKLAGKLQWTPGESGSTHYEVYEVDRVSDDEPIGVQRDEEQTRRDAAHILYAVVKEGADAMLALSSAAEHELFRRRAMAALDRADGGSGGWCLIDVDGSGLEEIERDDISPIWRDDAEALAYVRWLAERGDYEAAEALRKHERDAEELEEQRRMRRCDPGFHPSEADPQPPHPSLAT